MTLLDEDTLDRLQESLKDRLTKKDFMSSFERVLKVVQQIQQAQSQAIQKLEKAVSAITQKLSKDHEMSINEIKKGVNEGFIGKELKALMDGLKMTDKEMRDKMSRIKDGERGPMGPAGMAGLADEAKIQKMLSKSVGDELKKLHQKIEKLEKRPTGKMGMRKVPIVRFIDLSSSVDGSATTFNLPRDTVRVIALMSTQFPQIWSTSDFSLAGQTLTTNFTMQSGQTLYVLIETLFYA